MVGIDYAMHLAISSLQLNQQAIAVSSQNIANANNPDYSRRIINQTTDAYNGIDASVSVKSIDRFLDQYVVEALRSQVSVTEHAEVINNYYERISLLFGKPGSNSTINATVDSFFTALKLLTVSPELTSLRVDAVNRGADVANNLSTLAYQLEELRYEADREVVNVINDINTNLSEIFSLNLLIANATNLAPIKSDLMEQRDLLLKELAANIDINIFYKNDGTVSVNTSSGKALIDQSLYEVTYTPVPSIEALINNSTLMPIQIVPIYDILNIPAQNLITSGTGIQAGSADTITTTLKNGKLKGLVDVRDKQIPLILDQIDNLANKIREEFNNIHNSGGGYPALSNMLGTRALYGFENHNFSGIARIGVVDDNGLPLKRPDGSGMPPLNLDFSKLASSGTGVVGLPNIQTIVNEINQYYYTDPISSRVELGNLYDVRLVAASDFSTVPNGVISLDFELNNESQSNSNFQILSVTVDNGATGLTSTIPAAYNVRPGERTKTGFPFDLSFAGGSGAPYTVTIQVQVTDDLGNISTGLLNFTINDNPGTTSVLNDRYIATSASGDAAYHGPATNQRYLSASLVDANGKAAVNVPGFLKLAAEKENYHIMIDDLTSKEDGVPSVYFNQSIPGTGKGFSSYFELNNFFVRNSVTQSGTSNGAIENSAINMAVRSDILNNSNLISLGKLEASPVSVTSELVGVSQAGASLVFNNNPSLNDTLTVNGVVFTLVNAAAANNQITLGASLPATLANIAAKLNALNSTTSGTVNLASYSSDNINALNITYNSAGTAGNNFTISGNFATTGVSLNNTNSTTTPSGYLVGGVDTFINQVIQPWTFEVAVGSNEAIKILANLSNQILDFKSAGNIPPTSSTLSAYSVSIISYNSAQSIAAALSVTRAGMLLDGYNQQIQNVSGVNIDEELASTMRYKNAYGASAKIITVSKELYDILFAI